MSYYFIANIRITNPVEYEKYIEGSGEIFKKYKGKYLAVDNSPLILEGEWDYTRLVLIEFPSKVEFDAWYNSVSYREILKYRLNAADCDTILIEGLK